MKRIFFTFYLFVVLVLALFHFSYEPVWNWYARTHLSREVETYLTDLTCGIVTLVEDRLASYPQVVWPRQIRKLQPEFGFPIAIRAMAALPLSEAEKHHMKEDGGYIFTRTSRIVMAPIGGSAQALVLGPIPAFDEVVDLGKVEMIGWTMVLLFTGLVSLLWGLPFWRHLQQIIRAARSLGDGDFTAQVRIPGHSALAPLGTTFNQMTERILHLLDAQKLLVNAVSHELRTPISRLRFDLEMTAESRSPEETRRRLGEMEQDIDDLEGLVSELLVYARFDRKTPELVPESIPVEEWLWSLIERNRILARGLCFHLHVADPGAHTRGDARFLTRAVENLLSNAIRHAKAHIHVGYQQLDGCNRIRVSNDGPPIPLADRARIFDPFTRLDSSRNRKSGGYGLGLAIVRQILNRHGGRALVEESDTGASFVLEWPETL